MPRIKHHVLPVVLVALVVAGCSSRNDVDMNTDYQWSNSQAEQKRLETIAEIAKQGEGGVVAAALLMQEGGKYQTQAPKTNGDRVADVAKTVLGGSLIGLGQIAATVYAADVQKDIAVTQSNNNKDVAINQSNNNATVTMQTNDTMANIAEATIVNPEIVNNTTICVTDATYTCE
jgi:hypothetical protein